MPDPVTEEEIRAGAEAEAREAREQYAVRMAKRWNRRAKYSLDPGNRRQAEARAAEWEKVANSDYGGIIKNKLTDRFIDMWNESDDIYYSIFPEGDLYEFY